MTRLRSICCGLLAMSLAMTVATPEVWGQRRGSSKEIGYQLGTMWYVGDLNPNNLFRSISNTAQGAYFRYNVNPRVSVRGQYVQGSVEVFDANHPNAHQQRRNLGFFNLVNEVSFTTEVNFRDHVVGNPKRRLVPFFSAGVAVFGHDPQGIKSNGLLTPLRAIGTEGQDWFPGIDPYKDWGVALPYGLGWKGTLGSTMTFQIEWGARKLWTDYLDDVSGVYVLYNPNDVLDFEPSSALDDFQGALPYNLENETGSGEGVAGEVYQRGDPGRNDRYGFFLVSLGFRVSKKATTCWEQ